jgi:hypothetical protein
MGFSPICWTRGVAKERKIMIVPEQPRNNSVASDVRLGWRLDTVLE